MEKEKPKTETEYLSVKEYANKIGVCEETVRRMVRSKRLKAMRAGRAIRIGKDEMPE